MYNIIIFTELYLKSYDWQFGSKLSLIIMTSMKQLDVLISYYYWQQLDEVEARLQSSHIHFPSVRSSLV